MAKHYNQEYRQEVAELVVDQHYSVREAADAINVFSTAETSRDFDGQYG
jgi:transposase